MLISFGKFFHQVGRTNFVFSAVAAAALVSLAHAQEKQDGLPSDPKARAIFERFQKDDPKKAFAEAEALAKTGNPDADFLLGVAYRTGRGVEAADPTKAIEFFRKAQKDGHKTAVYPLAEILVASDNDENRVEAKKLLVTAAKTDPSRAYRALAEGELRGLFTGKADFKAARTWLELGAKTGDADSSLALGQLLDGLRGFAEERKPKEALDAFVAAAKKDNVVGMVAAGSRYLNGEKSLRDEKQGRAWIAKAIEKKNGEAHLALGDYEQSKKNDKAAFAEFIKGGELKQPDSLVRAGELLLEGKGVEKDRAEALKNFQAAAKLGSPIGNYRSAQLIFEEEKPDLKIGYLHLLSAANSNVLAAQNDMALFYLSGKLGVADLVAAANWLNRAASNGYAPAQCSLGTLYERGLGVAQDHKQAINYYTAAARQGNPQALSSLGRIFYQGDVVKQDLPRAWAFLSLAVEKDSSEQNQQAKAWLEEISSKLSKDDIAKGKELAEEMKKPAPTSEPEAEKSSLSTTPAGTKSAASN